MSTTTTITQPTNPYTVSPIKLQNTAGDDKPPRPRRRRTSSSTSSRDAARLARNAEAASKYRKRKHAETVELESRVLDLETRNGHLKEYVAALKQELLAQKDLCISHALMGCNNCDDVIRALSARGAAVPDRVERSPGSSVDGSFSSVEGEGYETLFDL